MSMSLTSLRSVRAARQLSRALATSASPAQSAALSSASASSWNPPIAPGVEPAYDEALAVIAHDRADKRRQIQQLKEGAQAQDADIQKRIESLEVAADINDPQVRWAFENGKVDMSRPVFRHLREQAWRKHGALDKLSERLTLMRVIPDVVPSATPSVDLQVMVGEGAGIGDHGGEGGDVLAGVFLDPALTLEPPQLLATPFHTEERLYTVLMVDPDVPDEVNESYQTYAHWLATDVPLSATRNTLPSGHATALPYVPPHPQRGTPYHRYTTLLLEQSSPSTPSAEIHRDGFDVRAYIEQNNLTVAGIHFWRGQWRPENAGTVSKVYEEILREPEPRFGKPPKVDYYRNELGQKESKYF